MTDVPAAKAWVVQNVRQRTGEVASETQRLRVAQARMVELDLARKSGLVAPIEDMQIAANEAMVILAQIDSLAGRCAAQLAGMTDPAEIRRFLLNEIRQARAAAAARLEDWARMAAGRAAAEAASGSDAGPVGRPN